MSQSKVKRKFPEGTYRFRTDGDGGFVEILDEQGKSMGLVNISKPNLDKIKAICVEQKISYSTYFNRAIERLLHDEELWNRLISDIRREQDGT